jgi:hypothetical protein
MKIACPNCSGDFSVTLTDNPLAIPSPLQVSCNNASPHVFYVVDGSSTYSWTVILKDAAGNTVAEIKVYRKATPPTSLYPGGMSPVVSVPIPAGNGQVFKLGPHGNTPDPVSVPVYQKVLIHGKREYRIGTCPDCGRENTALTKYSGKVLVSNGCCSGCIAAIATEAAEAQSQLYAARSGGRIEERKVEERGLGI